MILYNILCFISILNIEVNQNNNIMSYCHYVLLRPIFYTFYSFHRPRPAISVSEFLYVLCVNDTSSVAWPG